MTECRIGVYVCHCGGNISDYVDVEKVVDAVKDQPGVVVARRAMFTCSDATQQEIVDDIAGEKLDGLVVASCSPKLHTFTFRGVARRAGLNPYQYTQVNIREQCSWTHTDDREGATDKAIRLVRAGIARTRLSEPLQALEVETAPQALVIGGGVTGMRSAIGLADIGLAVFLVERDTSLGGWAAGFGEMYPRGKTGHEVVAELSEAIRARPNITVFTGAEVVEKAGTFGNYRATIRVAGEHITVDVGQIIVATGFDTYQPTVGEYGYGIDGVVTLPEFRQLLDAADGPLLRDGKPVSTIAYIYCVGSRNREHPYCSKYCCSAAVHASLLAASRLDGVQQYHLYRDMRTYGRNELMFAESRRQGSRYLKFADDEPPTVTREDGGTLTVSVRDELTADKELQVRADLVVLVTGMVPRGNDELISVLKLPVGNDGFFNEIHPKLRPVETVVDGVAIAGACQSPKTVAESVASGLAAVAVAGALLKKGVAELDPQIAVVDAAACTGCAVCVPSCPFGAIAMTKRSEAPDGVATVALIDAAACKGCGACAPACPEDAIDLLGYRDAQVRAMIDSLAGEVPV